MLTPEQIAGLAESIVSGHQERMVAAMIRQLVAALVSDGVLTVTEMRLLEQVANTNRDALNRILLEYQRRIDAETRRLVMQALLDSDDGDVEILSSRYPGVAVSGASARFARMAEETAEGLAQIIARDNLRMASYAQMVWYDVAGEAITKYNQGAIGMDRILTDSVNKLQRKGISVIDYKSGVRSALDVAVRRHVVSQVGQASGRMTMARLEEFGHDLVQVSAHFGARPDHAAWQGKAYSLSGQTPGYPEFTSSTGYGTVRGLLGVNCRHTFGPYFPDITELPELPESVNGMTNDEYYEAVQKQRGYERAIRQTKRDIDSLQRAGLDDVDARLRLGREQAKLKKWVDDNKLTRLPKREKAYGIGSNRPRALLSDPRPKRLALPNRPGSSMSGLDIRLPDGTVASVVPGTDIEDIVVFAGSGTSKRVIKVDVLVDLFGGTKAGWQKVEGRAWVYGADGVPRRAMVHWFEERSVGIVDPKVKGWSKRR